MNIYTAIQTLQSIAVDNGPDVEVGITFKCSDCNGRGAITIASSPGRLGSTSECSKCEGAGWSQVFTEVD